ncbi:MAG: winged helix-turn-helix transcriptional regulator [Limnochordales bacterium]|nr:winged helix-turn-helix transcriptional regulator [Limnochordales bacterium]
MAADLPELTGEKLRRAAELFNLLSDPSRLRILHALAQRELPVGDLAKAVALSVSAASHQLRLLREARVVARRRVGRLVYHRLVDERIGRLLGQVLGEWSLSQQ